MGRKAKKGKEEEKTKKEDGFDNIAHIKNPSTEKKDLVGQMPESQPKAKTEGARAPSDQPKKAEELDLQKYPVTPLAHQALKEQGIQFMSGLRNRLIKAAVGKNIQLTLEETQMIVSEWEAVLNQRDEDRKAQIQALYESEDDTTAPLPQTCEICGKNFQPKTWNVVINGRPICYRSGDKIRAGNFVVITDNEMAVVKALCRNCQRDFRKAAQEKGTEGYSYSYEKAAYLAAKNSARLELQQEREQKAHELAGKSQKQRNRFNPNESLSRWLDGRRGGKNR